MIKRCLVTGANGFIGQPLCAYLRKQGYFVGALIRREPNAKPNAKTIDELHNSDQNWDTAYYGDLNTLNYNYPECAAGVYLESNIQVYDAFTGDGDNTNVSSKKGFFSFLKGFDTIFHLAGIAHTVDITKEQYWQVNVEATQQLLYLAHQAGVQRFIYFSSVKAENPVDDYGYSKQAAEEVVLTLGSKYGLHVSILRPSLVYGKGVKGNLAQMMKGIQQGWFPRLPETHNKRSLVSLHDVIEVAVLVASATQASGKIYTLTDGHTYSSHQIYKAMRQVLGKSRVCWTIPYVLLQILAKFFDGMQFMLHKKLPFNSNILNKLLGSAHYSNHLVQNDLGWRPQYNFHQVLPEIATDYFVEE